VRKADAGNLSADGLGWLQFTPVEKKPVVERKEAELGGGAPSDWYQAPKPKKKAPSAPLNPIVVCELPQRGGGGG
jgi:hypothetical protein